jgi:dipeptidyl-peptidase 4
MYKKTGIFLCSLIFLLSFNSFTTYINAEKANFKLAERYETRKIAKLADSRSIRPNWLKDSDKFWYSYKTSDGTQYYLVNPALKRKNLLFDRVQMAAKLSAITKEGYNPKDLPIKQIKFDDNNVEFTFSVKKQNFRYNITNKTLKEEKKKPPRRDFWKNVSPDKKWYVFVKNHNLYLMKAEDEKEDQKSDKKADKKADKKDADKKDKKEDKEEDKAIQLTTDGEKYFSYGWNDDEDNPDKKGFARANWFKDSKKIYVSRSDRRKVKELFLVNTLKTPRPTLESYKYTMPGDKDIPQSELLVIDIATRKVVKINTDKWKDQALGYYGANVTVGEKSDKIYFIRRNRTWKKVEACVADTSTGESKVLIAEESKPYLNFRWIDLQLVDDGNELVWWSERDGFGHYYLYDKNGKLKNRITSGTWVAGRTIQLDSKKRTLYFVGYGREKDVDPYYQMYYRVNLNGSGLKLMTPEDATHTCHMAESKNYFVDTFSRVDKVPQSVLRDSMGNVLLKLETMDNSRLLAAGWKPPRRFKVKAADGITDLYGVMWVPFDLDESKKYPVLSYVYPGPQSEPVTKSYFEVRPLRVHNLPLAQLGFIVVTVGQRGGSPVRPKWYHNYGYGNARDYPLEDNKYAIEQLADKYPFMDISRVGIYGRSGGGFMSAAAILKYPKFYKAAFSSCGNHDNNIYNISWGESHYGVEEVIKVIEDKQKKDKNLNKKNNNTPDENKKENDDKDKKKSEITFKAKFPTNQEIAANLEGKLFLIHGEMDNNVHPANTMRLANALIKAGKRFDFMIFPGQHHIYGEYTWYIERLMWYFFAEHLKGDYRTNTDIFEKH